MSSSSSSSTSSSSKPRSRRPPAKPKTKKEVKINAEIQQRIRLEKAVFKKQEDLMRTGVTQEFLSECSKYFQKSHYKDVVFERAISRICGYPLCNNKLQEIENTSQKYHISLTKKQVYETKEVENFCSEDCMLSSEVFMLSLDDTPLFMRKHLVQPSPSTKVEQTLNVSEKSKEQPPPQPENTTSHPPLNNTSSNNNNEPPASNNNVSPPPPATSKPIVEDASEATLQLTDILQSKFVTPELSNFGIIFSTLEHWRTRNTLLFLHGPQDESYIITGNEQTEQRRSVFSTLVTNQVPYICGKLAVMPSLVVADLMNLINTFSFKESLPAFTSEQLETVIVILLLALKHKNPKLKLDRWHSHFKIDKDELGVFLSIFEKPT